MISEVIARLNNVGSSSVNLSWKVDEEGLVFNAHLIGCGPRGQPRWDTERRREACLYIKRMVMPERNCPARVFLAYKQGCDVYAGSGACYNYAW